MAGWAAAGPFGRSESGRRRRVTPNADQPGMMIPTVATPLGGCGYGIDRLVEKTIGLGNVKEATLFPRDINRLTPVEALMKLNEIKGLLK